MYAFVCMYVYMGLGTWKGCELAEGSNYNFYLCVHFPNGELPMTKRLNFSVLVYQLS